MLLRCAFNCAFICFLFLKLTRCQRRIVKGERVQEDKRYVVYLVKSEDSKQAYNAWLCGGAIVTPLHIVTSAACVEDIGYMYAVAGYTKYVPADKINVDPCTKEKKKKVVHVCVPTAYEFAYPDVQKWANLDMAVVKVESPYDFSDESYKTVCSYIPNAIEISYERKYQQPGVDALVLGWGHKEKWRHTSDLKDYNSPELLYGPVRIQDKRACKAKYTGTYEKLHKIIDKYMICTMSHGNIDSKGDIIEKNQNLTDGCLDANGMRSYQCENDYEYVLADRSIIKNNRTKDARKFLSRRVGICQNDHGGPLVTWIGKHEMLIGVASVFRINASTSECIGPYLFTSTWCSSIFLQCVISEDEEKKNETRRWEDCERPLKEQGLTLKKRDVSWLGHPDGPAANELVQIRPQRPLHSVAEYRRDEKFD